jgi:hypothetical protein
VPQLPPHQGLYFKNAFTLGPCLTLKEPALFLKEQGVCHTVALPFTLKCIFKAKEEIWKLKYFTMQKYNLQKSSKRNQNPFIY